MLMCSHVEHARRLCVILVFLELPALHHRAPVRDFHAVKIIFDDDRALLRIALRRHAHGRSRRQRCRRSGGRRCIANRRCRLPRCGRSGLRGPVGLRWLDGRLGSKVFRPKHDQAHGQQRCHQDSQLRRELVFLQRRAHEITSLGFAAFISDGISFQFSGTGS